MATSASSGMPEDAKNELGAVSAASSGRQQIFGTHLFGVLVCPRAIGGGSVIWRTNTTGGIDGRHQFYQTARWLWSDHRPDPLPPAGPAIAAAALHLAGVRSRARLS